MALALVHAHDTRGIRDIVQSLLIAKMRLAVSICVVGVHLTSDGLEVVVLGVPALLCISDTVLVFSRFNCSGRAFEWADAH